MNEGILGLAMGFAGGFAPPDVQPTMQPPTGLSASYFDTGFDIVTQIDWTAPSEETPDYYYFVYNSDGIGFFDLTIDGLDVQESVFEYYDTYWSVSIKAQKEGYNDSSPATIDGTTPSGSYP